MALLAARATFAEEDLLANNESSVSRNNVSAVSFRITGDEGLPPSGVSFGGPQVDPGLIWVYNTSARSRRTAEPGVLLRTGTGKFIVSMMTTMSTTATRVQYLVNLYSTYDSGPDQHSRPALRIRPHIDSGRAWVAVQLRF